jgi:pimeloyl-ACP methyl ester carboxylesterase
MNVASLDSDPQSRSGSTQRNHRVWRAIGRGLLGSLLTLVFICAIGAVYQLVASARDARNFPPLGEIVEAGGFPMHIRCMGEGNPTVILEPGGGSNSLAWFLVQPEIAKTTRACAYDRAGMGWSDPRPGPRNGRHIADELHTLLNEADIPGPYVLAGWSYGGLFVRAYAMQFPEEVAGLAFLDASHPDIWTRTEQGRARYQNDSKLYVGMRVLGRLGLLRLFPIPFTNPPDSLPTEQVPQWKAGHNATKFWDTTEAESRYILDTMAQVRGATDLGDLPVVVVTAGENQGADGQWVVYQEELGSLSSNSVHITVEGAEHHSIVFDANYFQASSGAILQVVDAVRTGILLSP